MNVGYVLANSAAKFPHKEAIVCDQGRMTFAEFLTVIEEVRHFKAAVVGIG